MHTPYALAHPAFERTWNGITAISSYISQKRHLTCDVCCACGSSLSVSRLWGLRTVLSPATADKRTGLIVNPEAYGTDDGNLITGRAVLIEKEKDFATELLVFWLCHEVYSSD
jgi:hypothetical protein